MEKTFLVYCRHVSFVTKGGVWCYSLRLKRRKEFWGGGGVTQKLEGKIGGVMQKISLIFEKPSPPPLPVKNGWSLIELNRSITFDQRTFDCLPREQCAMPYNDTIQRTTFLN